MNIYGNRYMSGLLRRLWVIVGGVLLAANVALADEAPAPANDLEREVQSLKEDLMDLNRDLFILEEDLLAPSDTQVMVFLSMDVGTFFTLDSVQVKIDDKVVANYLYTPRELEALQRGGVHRIHLGNLKSGLHELTAFFVGKGPRGRDYKRGATLRFEKSLGPKYLELQIVDLENRQQPDFRIKEWE